MYTPSHNTFRLVHLSFVIPGRTLGVIRPFRREVGTSSTLGENDSEGGSRSRLITDDEYRAGHLEL